MFAKPTIPGRSGFKPNQRPGAKLHSGAALPGKKNRSLDDRVQEMRSVVERKRGRQDRRSALGKDGVQKPVKGTAVARKRHSADQSETLQITTTRIVRRALDRIVQTGLYGNSRAAAAERLLAKGIEQLLREGTILRIGKLFAEDK